MTHCIRGVPGPGAGSPLAAPVLLPVTAPRQQRLGYLGTSRAPVADTLGASAHWRAWDDSSRCVPKVRTALPHGPGTSFQGITTRRNRRSCTWPFGFCLYSTYFTHLNTWSSLRRHTHTLFYLLTKVLKRWPATSCLVDEDVGSEVQTKPGHKQQALFWLGWVRGYLAHNRSGAKAEI